ncbi:hypothetical protein Hrd1104_12205 [Halorhabdus sp. CBA1104]|uniref:hypothetical protein n=1 Tax=Halorhabdus sp. CBA1104 TaxID=1380432 RepID=UPI0012B350AC|nr:hypothetical protein [Halorhabdus sp. CBA1104]QGN07983.1 hypothetical protein Hrd1104_12205 [Halorhabdus sp. CBA1104]
MQRRAVAISVVLFLVVGAGAYAFIGISEAPSISLPGEAHTVGDTFSVQDRTYTVESVDGSDDGSGELAWTNESARYTETLANDSTVSPLDVRWDGQDARWSRTLEAGSTIPYENGTYRVTVNTSADSPMAMLSNTDNASQNTTIAVEDTLTYRDNETTVTAIDDDGVTLVWAEPYRVTVQNGTAPDSATFRQVFDVSSRLERDPAVYNETVSVDGVQSVVSREDNATVALSAYLPEPDTATFEEGEQVWYQGNDATIGNVTSAGVPLVWSAERPNTVRLAGASTVTLNDQQYFVYFPEVSSVKILPSEDAAQSYQQQQADIDYYHERMNGLWGVSILSFLAAIVLLAMGYLPVKG